MTDSILTFKSDRLTRCGAESLRLEALFQDKGILYISSSEGILNDPSSNGQLFDDPLMKYLRAGLAERERTLHSFRLKKALAKKRSHGERLGSQPRYGFMVVNGQLVTNPTEGIMIQRIMTLKTAGHSTRNIASILTSEGFQTRKGTGLSHTQVANILKVA
jgi:site-specific DNA recombinase